VEVWGSSPHEPTILFNDLRILDRRDGLFCVDLRHHAITELAESQTSDQTFSGVSTTSTAKRSGQLRQAKIQNLGVAALGDKNVGGLDAAVDRTGLENSGVPQTVKHPSTAGHYT
jgi:hypothetical protein